MSQQPLRQQLTNSQGQAMLPLLPRSNSSTQGADNSHSSNTTTPQGPLLMPISYSNTASSLSALRMAYAMAAGEMGHGQLGSSSQSISSLGRSTGTCTSSESDISSSYTRLPAGNHSSMAMAHTVTAAANDATKPWSTPLLAVPQSPGPSCVSPDGPPKIHANRLDEMSTVGSSPMETFIRDLVHDHEQRASRAMAGLPAPVLAPRPTNHNPTEEEWEKSFVGSSSEISSQRPPLQQMDAMIDHYGKTLPSASSLLHIILQNQQDDQIFGDVDVSMPQVQQQTNTNQDCSSSTLGDDDQDDDDEDADLEACLTMDED